MAVDVTFDEFDRLVGLALDSIPEEISSMVNNCMIIIEEEPPEGAPELLGLYDGIPLTERDSGYGGVMHDRIFIFMNPTLRICSTLDEVIDEVHITVIHEIAHHFGIEEDRLHELGYG